MVNINIYRGGVRWRGQKLYTLSSDTKKTNMQAIPTKYKKYHFRSRLEARWAVYFDHLQIEYLYEMEGFRLADGSGYLPDFFLPDHKMYAEVKPFCQHDTRWELFTKGQPLPLVLLFGEPHAMPCRSYQNGLEGHYLTITGPDAKYYPLYYAGSLQDNYYATEERYQEAIVRACSYRFEGVPTG